MSETLDFQVRTPDVVHFWLAGDDMFYHGSVNGFQVFAEADISSCDRNVGTGPAQAAYAAYDRMFPDAELCSILSHIDDMPYKFYLGKQKHLIKMEHKMTQSGRSDTTLKNSVVASMMVFECVSEMQQCTSNEEVFRSIIETYHSLGFLLEGQVNDCLPGCQFLKNLVVPVLDGPLQYCFAPAPSRCLKMGSVPFGAPSLFKSQLQDVPKRFRFPLAAVLFLNGIRSSWRGLPVHPIIQAVFGIVPRREVDVVKDWNWIVAGEPMETSTCPG